MAENSSSDGRAGEAHVAGTGFSSGPSVIRVPARRAIEEVIVDSDMTFEESIAGTPAPPAIIETLCLAPVRYYAADGRLHQGQLVVHQALRNDVTAIFQLIEETRFLVNKVASVVRYGWSDAASMADNNTSGFCYRLVAGTGALSTHAFGWAVDINPVFNPVVYSGGEVWPPGARYDLHQPGTLSFGCPVFEEFIRRGWLWGRDLPNCTDYHHFEKRLESLRSRNACKGSAEMPRNSVNEYSA
jgi:hypothetical protein